jgi:hypothetical protein
MNRRSMQRTAAASLVAAALMLGLPGPASALPSPQDPTVLTGIWTWFSDLWQALTAPTGTDGSGGLDGATSGGQPPNAGGGSSGSGGDQGAGLDPNGGH